jgi:Fe-S-cluster containining protein
MKTKLTKFAHIYLLATYKLKMAPTPNYQDEKICSTCGGQCCKNMPGIASPEQFGVPDQNEMFDNLLKALSGGKYAVDYWEGDERAPTTYYIRPRTKRHKNNYPVDPSFGGECTFLNDKGCELLHDERPETCKSLKPGIEDCTSEISKLDSVKKWIPYQKIIKNVLRKYDEEFT